MPSYSEALTLTSPAQPSGQFHSYSPEKAIMHSQSRSYSPSKSEQVLLMNHDYSEEEIPLQETVCE